MDEELDREIVKQFSAWQRLSPYFVLDGHEPRRVDDVHEWGRCFEEHSNRIVEQTTIGELWVSTVFLGIDHNFWGGPPILFETMVFAPATEEQIERMRKLFPSWSGKREEVDGFTRRYHTWNEAAEGHTMTVSLVRAMLGAEVGAEVDDDRG